MPTEVEIRDGAVQALQSRDDEIKQLRAALAEIADMHKGDQPAAYNVSDLEWANRHILTMRIAAKKAINPQSE